MESTEYAPHATFAGIQHEFQQEWTFVQKVVPNIGPLFTKLEDTILNLLFYKLFGEKILPWIRNWVSVPAR